MGRGYSSSRDLEYRIIKNVRIKLCIKGVTKKSIYTGEGNMVIYDDARMSLNQFGRRVKREILPNCKNDNINIWINAYVTMQDKDKKNSIKVLLKDIPILPDYKEHENDILNNKFINFDLKINHNNKVNSKNIDNKQNMPRKKTKVNLISTETHATKTEKEFNRKVKKYNSNIGMVE